MIPSIVEIMPSVLKVLADGELHGKKEIVGFTAAEFGVTESEMKEKLQYGAGKYKNRVGWALINLKNKGLIQKEATDYRITETGKRAANASPAKLTAKFIESLTESDKDDSKDDDTPKSDDGNNGVKEEPPVQTQIEETAVSAETVMYSGVDPNCEFIITVKAKLGDKDAFKKLWDKYRPILVPMFRYCKNLNADERVSEAALVFVRKIELFNPKKIGKKPEDWTFSYMLTGGAKNAVDKIIRHSKKEGKYSFFYNSEEIGNYDDPNPNFSIIGKTLPLAMSVNPYDYEEKYNPEIQAMRAVNVPLEEREKKLMDNLSPLQITIMQLRQTGKTFREIADEMGYGFTKVRLCIIKARELASSIFEVNYC